MNGQQLSTALRDGTRVYGTMTLSPSPRWPAALAGVGLDFVMIDTEHVSLDREKLSWMCLAYDAKGIAPIVRIPAPDPYQATMALDGGATGVIAPYVESAEEVRALVQAVKVRPIKGRLAEQVARGEFPNDTLRDYVQQRNANHALIVNTESVPAMDALENIVSVPGLDGVLIGPHDLSCSLGVPEQYQSDTFQAAAAKIFQTARAHNVGAGIHYWGGPEEQVGWLRAGANMLVHSVDIRLFVKCLTAELSEIRAGLTAVSTP